MFKLPFGWQPYSWGLKGKTREIMKAEYELTGYELKRALLKIEEPTLTPKRASEKSIDLEFEFGLIDKRTQLRRLVALVEDDKQRELANLELDYKEAAITENEYQKRIATLKGEPWVTVLSMDFGGKKSLEGSFELDWNESFVDNLQKEGYIGQSPDHIVNQWFMEVCRNVALEEFDGTGNFTGDSAANLEAVRRWSAGVPPAGGTHREFK